MKITRLRTAQVVIPFDPPIGIGHADLRSNGCVLVWLETDEGITGEGLVAVLNADRLALLEQMVHSFSALLIGLDPQLGGAFSVKAGAGARALGGMAVVAQAAIENAMFDLRARALGVNVSRMLGAVRTTIPAYHSGELWITHSLDALQRAAEAHCRAGFRGMKMRLKGDVREDVARVRAVREAIGPGIALMADLNQKMSSVPEAIRLGRQLEEFNLAWLEEPIAAHNHAGEAAIAAALDTPIASGESVHTSRAMLEMLRLGSVDLLMPDLQRMGGPSEFIKACALAEAFDVPVSGHLFPEMTLALAAAIPNATVLEYMPWASAVYAERVELDANGHALVPTRPGWGFSFDPEAVRKYSLENLK
jgi:L-alanine-DL-glutamate epimerase-like enolase superfamily enzyme